MKSVCNRNDTFTQIDVLHISRLTWPLFLQYPKNRNWSKTRDSIVHLLILRCIHNFWGVDDSEEKVWSNNSKHFEHRLHRQGAVFHNFLFFIFLMIQATWLIGKADICSLIHLTFLPHVFQIRDTDSLQKSSGKTSFSCRCIELTPTSFSLFLILQMTDRKIAASESKSSTFSSGSMCLSFTDVLL